MALIWLKPSVLFIYPSHKWDGNELKYCLPLILDCRWFQPTDRKHYKHGFSLNNQYFSTNAVLSYYTNRVKKMCTDSSPSGRRWLQIFAPDGLLRWRPRAACAPMTSKQRFDQRGRDLRFLQHNNPQYTRQ